MKLAEILERLRQPVPPHLFSQKRLRGETIDYIAWYDICDLLDERCGLDGWTWKQIECQQFGNRLTQTWELTIIGSDRSLSRQATGDEDIDVIHYGSPATNVEAQCLRRCASKFGMARYLWRRENPNSVLSSHTSSAAKGAGQISRAEWLQRRKAGEFKKPQLPEF